MSDIKIKGKQDFFMIETSFVDKYIKDANPSFVKVYIYLARHLTSSDTVNLEKIAEDTGLLKSDVNSALKYWDKSGVIKYTAESIELLKLSGNTNSLVSFPSEESEKADVKEKPQYQPTASVASAYKASNVIKTVTSDENLSQLFVIIGQLLNKTLSPNDYKIIYSFVDYLNLPKQVIIVLFEYCISISQTNMRYIEKVAYSWADKGINTPERALEYVQKLSAQNSVLAEYKKNFKIRGRDFSDTETAFILSWVNDLNAGEELIMYAYDTSIMNTGKISFRYMDTVIRSAIESGTLDKKNEKLSSNVKKSSFRNYPADTKVGDIEKQMIEKMMSSFGGETGAVNE